MKVAESDIRQLSSDPEFQRTVNQALTNRLMDKLVTSNKVLDSVKFHGNSPVSLEKNIMNALVAEYLESESYHLAKSVLESEANLKDGLKQRDIQGALLAWQSTKLASRSALASLVRTGADGRLTKQSVSTQVDSTTVDDVDYKLMRIEIDHADREKLAEVGRRSRAAGVLEQEGARLRREMQAEMERQQRVFKDKELQRVRVEERARFDSRVKDLELRMERVLREKLRVLRERETEIKMTAEEQKKHIEGMRTEVQRQLMNQMSTLDRERAEFVDSKHQEYNKIKSLDYKLDKREMDLNSREKFIDVQDSIAQESVENKRQALLHSYKEKSSLDSKHQALIDDLVSKQADLSARLESKDREVQELLQEVKRREIENSDKSSKASILREENVKLRDLLNTQVELGKRKDVTLGLYEKRIDSLVVDNIKIKEMLAEMKKNWIMMGEAKSLTKVSGGGAYKPII